VAKKASGNELYELLAARRSTELAKPPTLFQPPAATQNAQDAGSAIPHVQTSPLSSMPVSRSGREVSLSLDSAFVIFVAVLILLGAAYTIGRQHGLHEQSYLRADSAESKVGLSADPDTVQAGEGPLRSQVMADRGKYTLKLMTMSQHEPVDLERMKIQREELLQSDQIRRINAEVHVFDNGAVYILSVGVFPSRADPDLEQLKAYFSDPQSSPAFRSCSIERIGDLGEAVY